MKIKKGFEMISTSGMIRSFRLLETLLDSTLAKIILVAANFILAWIMKGFRIGGFGGLIGMAFLIVGLIITEVFLTVIAGVAEISAEIIADCIAPRPEGLYFGVDKKNAPTTRAPQGTAKSQPAPTPQAKPAQPAPTRPIQKAANPRTPPALRANRKGDLNVAKDDARIRLFSKSREISAPEVHLCDIHMHCIREYEQMQQARGIRTYDLEAIWIWYALTDLMAEAYGAAFNVNAFRKNALLAMFLDIPQHTEDFIYSSIVDGYKWFVDDVHQLQHDRTAQALPRQSLLECYLDTIGQQFNRSCDAKRQDDLEMCLRAALEVAEEELNA